MAESLIATPNRIASQEHAYGLLPEGIWQYDHVLGHLAPEVCGLWTRNMV